MLFESLNRQFLDFKQRKDYLHIIVLLLNVTENKGTQSTGTFF